MRVLLQTLVFFLLVTQMCFAQWVHPNGPEISYFEVHDFAFEGADFFICTEQGVYRSTNNGTSWFAAGLSDANIRKLAVNGTNLFAAGRGVFLSNDKGITWSQVGLDSIDINALIVKDSFLFAGTWDGVFRSSDNGTSWNMVNNGLSSNPFVCAFAVNGNNLLASGQWVYLSTDNGTTWDPVGTSTLIGVITEITTKPNTTDLFASMPDSYVFRSTNNGQSWMPIGLWDQGVVSLAMSADGINLYAGSVSEGVYRSTNNGYTWTKVINGLTDTSVQCVRTMGQVLFAGTTRGGVFFSTNYGTSWTALNAGLPLDTWDGISVSSYTVNETDLFAGSLEKGVLRSSDGGTNWIKVNSGLTQLHVTTLAASGMELFAGTYIPDWLFPSGLVFLSTNRGNSWAQVGSDLTPILALTFSNSNLFAGTWNGVFRSSDNGTSWTAVNNGLTNTAVWSLATDGTNLFAGTIGINGGVYLSTNNGTNWVAVNNGLTNTQVWSLATDGTIVFAGTDEGVYLSTNNGTNWAAVNNGLTNTQVWSLATDGTIVFAGTDGGVYLSTNNGTNWASVNTGLMNSLRVNALVVNGMYLYAGTESWGVWRRPLSEIVTSVEENQIEIPSSFNLSQNFPNPFNPRTKIKYYVPQTSNIVIKVFDVLGNEIETLVNKEKQTGTYELTWYADNLPSGVYFYQLKAGEYTAVKKMLLIK